MELSLVTAGKENAFQPGWEPAERTSEEIHDGYFILYNQRFAGMCLRIFALRRGPSGETALKRYHPVNTICPEDAELALVVTAEVNEATPTLAGAG
jgi:hypothetical protein